MFRSTSVLLCENHIFYGQTRQLEQIACHLQVKSEMQFWIPNLVHYYRKTLLKFRCDEDLAFDTEVIQVYVSYKQIKPS